MSAEPKRLGEILLEKKMITQEQLAQAIELQKLSGDIFGEILIQKKWVSEIQILQALSDQFKIPFVRLDANTVDWVTAKQFPMNLLSKNSCFPVKQDSQSMTVAVYDPLDAWTASALEAQSRGRTIHLVLATKQDIKTAIQELGRRKLNEKT